jgi:hypothetical protein
MLPSFVSLPTASTRSQQCFETRDAKGIELNRFEWLSNDLKDDIILKHLSGLDDCKELGRWCRAERCDENLWQRACMRRGWVEKPNHFTWRVWYARNCNPKWAREIDIFLSIAIYEGNMTVMQSLIEKGANFHKGQDELLFNAIESGSLQVVKFLYNNGFNIRASQDFAIVSASESGYVDIVKFFFDHNLDIQTYDNQALIVAIEHNHYEVVEFLVTHGANVNAREGLPLKLAIQNGRLNIVQLLLTNGATPLTV